VEGRYGTTKDRLRVLRNELQFLDRGGYPLSDPMDVSPNL